MQSNRPDGEQTQQGHWPATTNDPTGGETFMPKPAEPNDEVAAAVERERARHERQADVHLTDVTEDRE